MDRRTFLTGAGTLGGLGVAGTGAVLLDSRAADARADGLAQAAGAEGAVRRPAAASQANKTRAAGALTLGYLPGSAAMFGPLADGRGMRLSTIGLRWGPWDASSATSVNQRAIQSLFGTDSAVDVSIGILRRADSANAILSSMEIVAHYALLDAPYFAPFNAWSYRAAGAAKSAMYTQPISFSARVPDRVALSIDYALHPLAAAGGLATAGSLYLPIGAGSASGEGLATGLYIVATPAAGTGAQPDLGAYSFSGDVHAPIVDGSGRAPDFDYLTLAIRPIAV